MCLEEIAALSVEGLKTPSPCVKVDVAGVLWLFVSLGIDGYDGVVS